MLTRIRDAYRWVHGIQQCKKGDHERALIALSKIQGSRKASSEFHAMVATISLAQGDHYAARCSFESALFQAKPTRPDYKQYVDHYCWYYLSALDGNEGAKIKHLEEALRSHAPSIIKQWLPLS